MEIVMRMNNKLPISTKSDARLSFHLSSVLSEERYGWFYEHFINIGIYGERDVFINFIDNAIDDSYRSLFSERICYEADVIKDENELIDILKAHVNRKFYSYLWLDKYEIPETAEYHTDSFVHPVLVYGYDDSNEIFNIINFTWSKGSYVQEVPYESIKSAYILMRNNIEHYFHMIGGHTVLTAYKLNPTAGKQTFSLNRFLVELSNYIYSRGDNISEHNPTEYITCEYGLNGYKKLLYVCDHVASGAWLAFKSIFDLNLHKQFMYQRLCYIRDRYYVSEKTEKYIDMYKRVSQIFNTIQLLNMKYQTQAKQNAASFCTNPQFIEKMRALLEEAYNIERETLVSIYMDLLAGPELKYTPMSSTKILCEKYKYNIGEKASITAIINVPIIAQRIELLDSSMSLQWRPMGLLRINDECEYLIEDNIGIGHKNRGIDIVPCEIRKLEYIEIIPSSSDIRELKLRICGLNESIYWDFTKHETYSWIAEKDIDDVRYDEGTTYIINGNDANISCKNVNIPTERGKYIYVKYRNRTNSEVAQLFFNTYTNTVFSEEMSKIITIGSGEDSIEYVFDITDNNNRAGIIKDMRFDPTGYDNTTENGECMIEYIKVNDTAPVYDSKIHFCGSQGVNGWFYYAYNNGTAYREMRYDEEKDAWGYPTCPDLFIMNERQNSYNHMATVRRYVCQADGTYNVKFSVLLDTPNEKSYLTIKRNHRIIEKCELCSYTSEGELKLDLEYGENLNFEYYNEDENTMEEIKMEVSIEKIADKLYD